MTADELRDSVARSRAAQGLDPVIGDPSTLHAVVTVLRPDLPATDARQQVAA